ncbi:MAG: sodium:proton antiporter [Deltaproteobacteria bacterium]|nr:sodium:proton antiporter [Deltaproteobacteria bacterium]
MHLSGAELSIFWVIPFVGMLLSTAICPLVAPHFWERHYGKAAVGWGLAFLLPCAAVFGPELALYQAWHTLLLEYLPFVILLFALFTVAGGISQSCPFTGKPGVNTAMLLAGTLLASFMGTTGAAMLFIRPLLKANEHRKHKTHTVVFFIFLVANIGGGLTPLGDPPLFLGFLRGVPFFWTAVHLAVPVIFMSSLLLLVYFILDTWLWIREGRPLLPEDVPNCGQRGRIYLQGKINFLFLLVIIGVVLISGSNWAAAWGSVTLYHVELGWREIFRNAGLLVMAALSLRFTSYESRLLNGFNWEPIAEVAKIFLGIFLSMIPAIAILQAGEEGVLAPLLSLVSHNGQPVNNMYFWSCGLLSAFLDNAPTYVVFFNTAGGDVAQLTGELSPTLAAISVGAVFMGAATYIGNAPNFMVRSIAERHGVKMPSFFGYMIWSAAILGPGFIALSLFYF